ncbi:MAG: hypothetical protein MHMPM18_001496 [Marteilia pararefringens]
MAIYKLVALIAILASIPTPVLSPDSSTEDHQTQSMFSPDVSQCIDHLKSRLNAPQLSAHLQMVNCLQTSGLTYNQCYLREISPVLQSTHGQGFQWISQTLILDLSLGPYKSNQNLGAEGGSSQNFWRLKATGFGCFA